jgi:zinc protease
MPTDSLADLRPCLGYPAPQQRTLDNGCPVTLLPLADASVACLQFWCQAGSWREQSGEAGIAHFLEHMVFKGSDGLPAGAFDHRVEAVGGQSNAATGFDDVHYHVLLPPDGLSLALELLPRLVLTPGLQEQDFQLERQVVLEELAQSEDQPEEVAFQQLLALGCGQHPYGRPILGTREDLQGMTPAAMGAFQSRHYRADRCAVAIGGRFDPEVVLQQLQSGPVGELPATTTAEAASAGLAVAPGRHRVHLPRLESARLLMLWAAPPAKAQQQLSGLDLWTTALAEGRSSRLVKRLREELQLVESIDLELHPLEDGSLMVLEAVCEPSQLEAVAQEVETLLQQAAAGMSQAELARARRLLDHGHRFSLEAIGPLTQMLGQTSLSRRLQSFDEPLQRLESWNSDSLKPLAAALDPSLACILEVLPL